MGKRVSLVVGVLCLHPLLACVYFVCFLLWFLSFFTISVADLLSFFLSVCLFIAFFLSFYNTSIELASSSIQSTPYDVVCTSNATPADAAKSKQ